MSIGALSPHMWEGLAMGITYLNEVEGLPVVMCSGEGGMPPSILKSRYMKYFILQIASGYFGWDEIIHALPDMIEDPCAIEIKYGQGAKPGDGGLLQAYKVLGLIAKIRGVPQFVDLASPPTHQTKYSIEEAVAKMIQSMSMAWGFRVPVYPKISGTKTARAVLNNLARNPYAAALCIDGEDGGTGAAYNVSMDKMGHPIASNIRDCYLDLVKQGKQNELPLIAAGGVGKGGNLAANAAALIMLGASAVDIGKYIMQAAAGCFGDEYNRCNVCNLGKCPRGITTQDPKLYRRLDPGQGGRAGGRSVQGSGRGAQEDLRAARQEHRAPDRHVRCSGRRRQGDRGPAADQLRVLVIRDRETETQRKDETFDAERS